MVFHSFHILIDDLLIKAEEVEKIGEEPVSPRDLAGKPLAGCG